MKIGVKIWPDKASYACNIAEHCDFIEVMAKRGSDFSFLEDTGLPTVIHAEHGGLGVNYADGSRLADSKDSLRFALELADRLDARVVIVHPGYLDGSPGSILSNAVSFLKGMNDNRIVLENLVLRESAESGVLEYPFSTPEKMKGLMEETGMGLCLDFSHAHVTATLLGSDCMKMLHDFNALGPRHFHACGGVAGRPEDAHMHLWEGNLDIGAFRRMLPKAAWVTLETPTDLEGQLRDIEIMRG